MTKFEPLPSWDSIRERIESALVEWKANARLGNYKAKGSGYEYGWIVTYDHPRHGRTTTYWPLGAHTHVESMAEDLRKMAGGA